MATLGFKVNADYEKVIRLREEIRRLEGELSKVNMSTPKEQVRSMQEQLMNASKEFKELTQAAMKTGAAMEGDFKNKINIANVALNEMNRKVLEQKAIVQDAAQKVRDLGRAYREATSSGRKGSGLKKAISEATANLEQDKAILLQLTQTQAAARLSVKELKDEYASLREDTDKTKDATDGLNLGFGKLVAMLGGAQVLKGFVGQMVAIRGQFQDMETSIRTLVGEDMTAKLMPQIKEMAKVSPLTMTDIVGAEKMMLGFNIAADKTIGYLKALSDVSMGNSQKFNSLTLAFSQMSAAGKLMGQDLNQMINAGFNPLQEIAKTTGKSIAQLKEEMSKGKISAEMVQQAFISATSEGGKYYKMSENASKTITGQISMMEDAIDAAFNEMGTKTEGIILKSIQSITKLIESYETIGKVIISVAATYGTYRAALLVTTASEKLAAISRLANIKHMTKQALVTDMLTKKTKALKLAMKGNVWALALSALVALGGAIWSFVDGKREEKKAIEESNKVLLDEVTKVNTLNEEYKNANTTEERRLEILKEMKGLNPEVVKGIEDEAKAVEQLQQNVDLYNKQKTVELAVNKSDEKVEFDAAKNNLDEAKSEVESLKHDMVNVWTDISPKLQEMLMSDDSLPKAVKDYLKRVLLDPAKDSGQKALDLLKIDIGGPNLGYGFEGHKSVSKLLRGYRGDISEYKRAIYALKTAQQEYTTAANNLATRVDGTIDNLYGKTEQASQIRMNLNFLWMPTPESTPTPAVPAESPNLDETYKEREKEWKTAKSALDAAKKARNEYTVAGYDALVADELSKRKLFNAVGGNTTTRKTTTTVKKDPILTKLQNQQKDVQAARKIQDITNRVRQLIIKEEKDERKRAEMQLEYDNEREVERIKREKEDYINALVIAEYEKNVAYNKAKKKKDKKKETDITKIRAEVVQRDDVKAYDTIVEKTEDEQDRDAAKKKKDKEDADRIKYLKEYGDYKQKVLAITEEYNKKIEKAENQWEKDYLTAERDKVLKDMELAKNKAYQNIFKDPAKMSLKSVRDAINLAQKEIKKITSKESLTDSDINNVKVLQEALDKLQSYEDVAPFDNLQDGTDGLISKLNTILRLNRDIAEAKKTGNKDAEKAATEQLKATKQNLKENLMGIGVDAFAKGLTMAADALERIAEISGDADLQTTADVLGGTANMVTSIGMGASFGGWIGAVIGGVTALLTEITDAIMGSVEANAINQKALEDYEKKLKMLEYEYDSEKFDTMFGEDVWGGIRDMGEKLRGAREEFEKLNEEGYEWKEILEQTENLANKWGITVNSGINGVDVPYVNENIGNPNMGNVWYDTNTGEKTGYTPPTTEIVHKEALGNATIKQKGKKATTLAAMYPDLFNEDGTLKADKIEEAKLALASLNEMKLKDATGRDLLADTIEWAEKVEEYEKLLKDAAQSYLDNIGTALGDAIVNNILRGEDALDAVGATGAEIITQLGRDLATSFMINSYLNTFSDRMTAAFENSDEEEVANIVGDIVEGFPAMMEQGTALVKGIYDATKGTEYDVYEHAKEQQNQQASAKGYATLSEETGSELSSRALAQYESNLRIETSQRQSTDAILDMKESMIASVFIHQKTNYIAEDCRKLIADSYNQLQAINENTKAVISPIIQMADIVSKIYKEL